MRCIDCGAEVETTKPCMKRQHPGGAPICDACCRSCLSEKGIGGRRGECVHLEEAGYKR